MGIGWRDTTLAIIGLAAGGMYTQWREYDAGPVEARGLAWVAPDSEGLPPAMRVKWSIAPLRMSPMDSLPQPHLGGDYLNDIKLVGVRLIVVSNKMVNVLDARTGRSIQQVAPAAWGGSHTDGILLQHVTRDPRRLDVLWLYDFTNRRLLPLRDSSAARFVPASPLRLHERSALRTPFEVDGRVLASGYFDHGLLMEFDLHGRALRTIGLPPLIADSIVADIRHHLNFGALAPRPRSNVLAIAYQATPRLDIVRADGRPIARLIWGDEAQSPPQPVRDKRGNLRFALRASSRSAFLSVDATARHIFALYGGERVDAPNGEFQFGRRVAILDWNGTVVRELLLDRDAANITVDESETQLFAHGRAGEPIVRYSLPSLLVAAAVPAQRMGSDDAMVHGRGASHREGESSTIAAGHGQRKRRIQ